MAGENFDRQYRLLIGKSGQTGFEIGGGEHPLHIEFSMEKSDLKTQNTGKLTIWNLNKAHLAELESKNCSVTLRAGYGGRLSTIFSGVVSFCTTKRDNADISTEIEVVDTLVQVKDTYISISYNGLINWKTILDEVGKQMGVAIQYGYNVEFGNIGNGYSFAGLARNILDKACECNGLQWSIQNGVLQVKKKGDAVSRYGYEISAKTGLLGYPEKVNMKDEKDTTTAKHGWDVTYFLNGAININDYVYLKSSVVTGYFYVHKLEYSGDNVSGDWTCKARLLECTNSESKVKSVTEDTAKVTA